MNILSTDFHSASGVKQAPETNQVAWFGTLCLLASIPALQALITWPWSGQLLSWQAFTNVFSLVTVCAEILIFRWARLRGFDLPSFVAKAPAIIKAVFAIWFSVLLVTLFAKQGDLFFSTLFSLRYVLHIIAFCALLYLVGKNAENQPADRFGQWFRILSIGGAIYLASLGLFLLTVMNASDFLWTSGWPSATSIRHIANYLAIFCVAISALLIAAKPKNAWLYYILLGLTITFIAWSGSRAAVLGLLCSALCGLYFVRQKLSLQKACGLLGIYAGAILASGFLPVPHPSFGMLRFFSKAGSESGYGSGRIEVWIHTWEEFLKQPLIGHGSGRFATHMHQLYGYDLDNPHNFLLQFAYDWGLVGGTAALIGVAWLGWMIFQRRSGSPLLVYAAVTGYALMISIGLLEGMLYHPMKLILVMALIAPIFSVKKPASA